jgi:hypothetical protein
VDIAQVGLRALGRILSRLQSASRPTDAAGGKFASLGRIWATSTNGSGRFYTGGLQVLTPPPFCSATSYRRKLGKSNYLGGWLEKIGEAGDSWHALCSIRRSVEEWDATEPTVGGCIDPRRAGGRPADEFRLFPTLGCRGRPAFSPRLRADEGSRTSPALSIFRPSVVSRCGTRFLVELRATPCAVREGAT